MLLCGAEEPLASNPQMYALDERSGDVTLADFGLSDANRYSLLWLGTAPDGAARLSAVVASAARALSLPMVSCAAWLDPGAEGLAGATRKVRYLHHKNGWEIRARDGVAIATKALSPDAFAWPPGDLGARTVLFLGGAIDSEALAQPVVAPCMKRLARSGMAPSEPFLDWLTHRGGAVVYPRHDDLGRRGLIVAGAPRLPLRALEVAGLIQETRTAAAAPGVWRLPP